MPLPTPPPNYNEATGKESQPPTYSDVVSYPLAVTDPPVLTSPPVVTSPQFNDADIPERNYIPQTRDDPEDGCVSCLICSVCVQPLIALCECLSSCWHVCCDDCCEDDPNSRSRSYGYRNRNYYRSRYYNTNVTEGDCYGNNGDGWGGGDTGTDFWGGRGDDTGNCWDRDNGNSGGGGGSSGGCNDTGGGRDCDTGGGCDSGGGGCDSGGGGCDSGGGGCDD